MSKTANWSYTNTATIRPYIGRKDYTGEEVYGDEYEIACTWEAKSEQARDDRGIEFVTRNIIYTEDLRPKKLDLIRLSTSDKWEEIRDRSEWDMSFFGEDPDVRLTT